MQGRKLSVQMLDHFVATVVSATLDHRIGYFVPQHILQVQNDLDGIWGHNRFRDLDERWKSASTGRRTACPTYFAKRLIQQGGAGGFACRSHGHNQGSASKLNKFPKTVKHPHPRDTGFVYSVH